ncbi:MAG: hypothetical protein ACRD2G_04165 [Terriglobia bacterium]
MKFTTSMRWGVVAAVLCCGLIGLAELVPQGESGGGWIPFVATRTATSYDLSGGQRKLASESVGPYARASGGSLYYRAVVVFGRRLGEATPATLQDRTTGFTYGIDDTARRAVIKSQPPPGAFWTPPSPPTEESWAADHPQDLYLGTKTVGGIELQGWRLYPSRDGTLTGEAWYAPSLNYVPVLTKMIDSQKQAELDVALGNIQLETPDPKLFQVPVGFTVAGK